MIAAVLIGRKGSKGFPGKNLYKILGKPMAYYPIKAAGDCAEIDKIYISTDDPKLMKLAAENQADVIRRPKELCTDRALGEDVFIHAYGYIRKANRKEDIELLVLLMCNAPAVTGRIISEGINVLRKFPEYDSCVTVSRYNMWSPLRARRIDKEGLLKPFISFEAFGDPAKLNCDRDSQGDVWFADMGVSIIKPRCLENIEDGMLPQKWMGQKIYPLKQEAGLDVDYRWQIPMAERWIKENLPKRKGK